MLKLTPNCYVYFNVYLLCLNACVSHPRVVCLLCLCVSPSSLSDSMDMVLLLKLSESVD